MLKKSITYETFDGEKITEDFYFNLSKAELVEMELSVGGGLKDHLEKIVAAEDGKEIIAEMKKIVLGAYGKKSPDGKRFIKNQQLRDEFESTEAYSVLFMELVTNAGAAAEFVNGIVPQDLRDNVNAAQEKLALDRTPSNSSETDSEPKKLTSQEVAEMDADELKSGLATGKYVL